MEWRDITKRPSTWTAPAGIGFASVLISALLGGALFPVGLHAAGPPSPQAGSQATGQQIFRAACATCHGADGRGAARDQVGFDIPLPDFSDCRFATPEPESDWIAVVHRGGPARAFDRRMPAFGDALSDAEIGRVVDYVRSFCSDRSWPRGDLNLPRAMFTEKAFPENEAVSTSAIATSGPGAVDETIVYEQRFGARNQIEVTVPIAAAHDGETWRGGLGDIALGVKRALYHSLERGSILSIGGEVALPTGEQAFGRHVTTFESFLALGQILPHDSFVQVQTGVELSSDRARVPHEAFWRAAVGKSVTQDRYGRAWTPAIELLGARELEADRRIEWDIVPQLQVTLSTRQHIMVSGGIRIPVSERAGRHPQVVMYALWDWFDGGLRSGW